MQILTPEIAVKRFVVLFAALVALLGVQASAQDLPRAKPEEVGFSAERLDRITRLLKEDAAEGTVPGFVLLIARHGKVAYFESVGVLDPDTKAPMTKDAIFRIYSMSKPITQVTAMMLYEQGKITLDEPIAKYLPEFKDVKVGIEKPNPAGGPPTLDLVAAERPILIQDLMRHTSGLTYGFFGSSLAKKAYVDAGLFRGDIDNAEFTRRIAKLPLAFQPGTTWDYSHSTDVLGRLIEIVSAKSLYQTEKELLLDPLGMKETSFYVADAAKHSRIAEPLKADRVLGVDAQMNDPRVAVRWEPGGQGMVGTTTDYARFLQMLVGGGSLEDKRYLSRKTVTFMTADHLGNVIAPGPYYLPGPGYGFGLGFGVRKDGGVSPIPGTPGDYYWGGVAGTYFWVDPREDMFVVFMMQSPKQRMHYRSVVRDMVYAALVK
jgi:CubicO group peptidase (beta-lactamase class C family)